LWHLASDEASYVFLRETDEERVLIALNNSDKRQEMRIPLGDTPAQGAGGFTLLLGDAKAEAFGSEARLALPAQSISIFLVE
jgi:hypothetical protein